MTLTHLADTDVCIKVLKKRDRTLANRFHEQLPSLALSDISVFELHTGAEKFTNRFERLAAIDQLLGLLTVLPFDTGAAHHAGNIRHVLESTGKLIGAYDILIAATARARGLILATGNVREFSRVDGLRVEKWA